MHLWEAFEEDLEASLFAEIGVGTLRDTKRYDFSRAKIIDGSKVGLSKEKLKLGDISTKFLERSRCSEVSLQEVREERGPSLPYKSLPYKSYMACDDFSF